MVQNALIGSVCFIIADSAPSGSVRQQMAAGMAGFCLLQTISEVLNG